MIASEETEPGTGWYYTNWLSKLSQNTSTPTTEIGKQIIDDFVAASNKQAPNQQTTLSLIDLAELKGTVPQAFSAFSQSTTDLISGNDYRIVSDARSNAKEFAKSAQINQVDLIHLAENMNTEEGRRLADALEGCVKYNVTSRTVNHAYGVSIYFPYGKLEKLDNMLSTYKKIGLDSEYSKCITSFANAEAGGQMSSTSPSSPYGSLFGSLLGDEGSSGYGGDSAPGYSGSSGTQLIMELLGSCLQGSDYGSMSGISADNSDWIDEQQIINGAQYYAENRFHGDKLTLTETNGKSVLRLPED